MRPCSASKNMKYFNSAELLRIIKRRPSKSFFNIKFYWSFYKNLYDSQLLEWYQIT